MNLYDTYLLVGSALIVAGCISLFSATVDGRRPRAAIIMLVIGFGAIYGASTQAGEAMSLRDIPRAIGHLIETLVR
jgi:hypothetical protein